MVKQRSRHSSRITEVKGRNIFHQFSKYKRLKLSILDDMTWHDMMQVAFALLCTVDFFTENHKSQFFYLDQ